MRIEMLLRASQLYFHVKFDYRIDWLDVGRPKRCSTGIDLVDWAGILSILTVMRCF